MRRGKKMIVLLCTMAVFAGAYCGTQLMKKNVKTVGETKGNIALTTHTAEELAGLSWTMDDTAYSFHHDESTWKTTDEPEWPVKQDRVQELADQLIRLQANRKLEAVENVAEYGLDKPAFSITASWKDGSSTTYSMGDATPFADGFYLGVSGQDKVVYTVATSLKTVFGKTKKDLVAMEEIPAVKNVVQFKVGNKLEAIKSEKSRMVDPAQLWYNAATEEPLDGTQIEALIAKAAGITWKELVSAVSTEEERSIWKLDKASATADAIVGSDGSSRSLLIGAKNDAGDYYARLPESVMVYTVKGDTVNDLLAASADELWVKSILPLSYESLSAAEFTTQKGSFRMEKPAEDKPENEDGSKQESSDQVAEAEAVQRALWDQVKALTATERLKERKEGDQILSIRAIPADGDETLVIISEYNAEFYQATVNGKAPMLVPADKIDLLVRSVRIMQ